MLTRILRSVLLAAILVAVRHVSVRAASDPPAPGRTAPAFTYRLLDGGLLHPAELRGHPYVLWMVATWCPSCETGTRVVASHFAFLRAHGVRVVEMELADNLGANGPPLSAFRKAAGSAAGESWYWGELTPAQTLALDPKGDMDVYDLVDARGRIVAASGNPAVSWNTIARFATKFGIPPRR